MDLENLTREKIAVLGVVLIILLAIVSYVAYSHYNQLALYSYAKSVPIQIGYNDVQNYWVLSAVVDEKTAFKLVLNEGTTETVGDEQVQTESEVGILVNPKRPYSKTNMEPSTLKYTYQGMVQKQRKAPAFDINDAGWLTTAVYELGVYKNGAQKTTETIEVDYQKPKVVYMETAEGKVTVNNLGILPQGVEVPSGDLILVYDPDGEPHIFNKADFVTMIRCWNDHVALSSPLYLFDWESVWKAAIRKEWLPKDVQLVHVSDFEVTSENQYITLTYSGIAFAGAISIYVPDELADTVVVQLLAPKPTIQKVTPSELPTIDEGDKVTFEVEVENIGTEGTVSISVSSTFYSFSPLTATTKNMGEGETFTFRFEAYALNVEADTSTTSEILVQGRGGSDTYTLLGEIRNVEGYTPPIPENGDGGEDGNGKSWWQRYWWVVVIIVIILVIVAIVIYEKGK